jgi:hypothetical protein
MQCSTVHGVIITASDKNYVCVTCGQDFTRKYSAYRHNQLVHREGGKIVRTLEYIIGRIKGEYFAADPVLFRRNREEQTANVSRTSFPFANVAHYSEDSQQYETSQHKESGPNQGSYHETPKTYATQPSGDPISSKREEIKSLCKTLFSNGFRWSLSPLALSLQGQRNQLRKKFHYGDFQT